MRYHGPNLNADMNAIWDTAVTNFPAMALAYREANVTVHQTNYSVDEASESFKWWSLLRDEFETTLGDSAVNVYDTGTAIRQAVYDYANSDDAAEAALRQASQDLPGDVPLLPEVSIATSQRTRQTSDSYEPPPPAGTKDIGKQPTIDNLLERAAVLDDRLNEAAHEEATLLGDLVIWLTPADYTAGGAMEAYQTAQDLVRQHAKVDPAAYQAAIDALGDINTLDGATAFGRFDQEVAIATAALNPDHWDGQAARDFRDNFLFAYPDVNEVQLLITERLRTTALGLQEARSQVYGKYLESIEASISACDAIIAGGQSNPIQVVIDGLFVARDFVEAATKEKGAGIAMAKTGWSEFSKAKATAGGETVSVIYMNFYSSMGELKKSLDSFDDALATSLRADYELVSQRRPEHKLALPRPAFVDQPGTL